MAVKRFRTLCINCGAVLTDQHGNRVAAANFDSRLPSPVPFDARSGQNWARCDPCQDVADQRYTALRRSEKGA